MVEVAESSAPLVEGKMATFFSDSIYSTFFAAAPFFFFFFSLEPGELDSGNDIGSIIKTL